MLRFIDDIKNINWDHDILPCSYDPNAIFDSFHSKLSEVIDKHAPIKKLTKKEIKFSLKPWITPGIKKSIEMKNTLFKKYLKNKSPYYCTKYKYYRNKLNKVLNASKKMYYNNYFTQNSLQIKNIWKGIRELISHKAIVRNIPSKLILPDNTEINDSKDLANTFNKYFASIGKRLGHSTSTTSISSALDFMDSPLKNSFVLTPVTTEEIRTEISKLNASKSTGPFSIPTKLLKLIQNYIDSPLEKLFNCSFSTGIVPDKFKLACVVPVFKKGAQTDFCNYRPISLLSIFNRLLEKLMYKRLINFIDREKILFKNQFGFREKHSTTLTTSLIIDKIQKAIEEGKFSCGIFLDLSKAFDCVNHQILLSKLEFYGLRGITHSWLKSYLSNRKQYVSIGNTTSDELTVSCGVPQGSVLGPLLFLLYINDFKNSSNLFEFHLFADDCNLFYAHKNVSVLENQINAHLLHIHHWLSCNRLSLNIDKSNFVVFHPPQKKISYHLHLSINQIPLKPEHSIKYLGLYLDSHLSFKAHIQYLCKKVKRSIGILSKLRHYVTSNVLIQLYYSFIYPYLIYGIPVWGNTYASTLKPLFILQKRTIRLITFSKFDEHTSPLFKQLGILKLPDIVYLHNALFMYNFHCNSLPCAFNNFFLLAKDRHNYNTRFAAKQSYCIPKARTNYGKFSLRFIGPKIWNDIDPSFKTKSKSVFKTKIISIILDNY